ncbi:MAG: hypothetical protein ABR526_02065 [Chthoniobacterales bacterium]
MSSGVMDAPVGFGFLIGVASRAGVSLGDALADTSGDGEDDALGLGSGVGDPFFFLPFAEGEGELFGLALGVSEGVGLAVGEGDAFDELLRFCEALAFGVSSGSGVLFGFGEAPGETFGLADGVGEAVDFFDVELLRFFGGGVGSRIFFNLSPSPSSA